MFSFLVLLGLIASSWDVFCSVVLVLFAEMANGWTDAPTATASAVSTGLLKGWQALAAAATGNFIGLLLAYWLGAHVAETVGKNIIDQGVITFASLDVALATVIMWSLIAARLGLPVSKTHSLFAALAGMALVSGGPDALIASGWVKVGLGVLFAILLGSTLSYLASAAIRRMQWHKKEIWRRLQVVTVVLVAVAHGGNDGMKYIGIWSLILLKGGITHTFGDAITLWTVLLFAAVMAVGTCFGGWRIVQSMDTAVNQHPDLDDLVEEAGSGADHSGGEKKQKYFKPYMSVAGELCSGVLIFLSQCLDGLPVSTTHAVVSGQNGAKAVTGKVHHKSIIKFVGGWVATLIFCFFVSAGGTWLLLVR